MSEKSNSETLSEMLDLDIAADAFRSQAEVDEELRKRGYDLEKLNQDALESLRKARQTS